MTRDNDRRAPADLEALAWLMDNSIPIPGTGGRRVGLDAIIGFVPGLGDLVSSGASLFVIVRAAGHGLPRITVVRMLLNLGLDLVVGAIPVLGDAFGARLLRHRSRPRALQTSHTV